MLMRPWMVLSLFARPDNPVSALLILCIGCTPSASASSVTVYRCMDENGTVEFRQHACDQALQQKIQVDISPSGWLPAKAKPAKRRAESRPKPTGGQNRDAGKRKLEKQCWQQRKRLEKLEWKMRRGYKAGEGTKLRRQRRDQEDYLSRFCQR